MIMGSPLQILHCQYTHNIDDRPLNKGGKPSLFEEKKSNDIVTTIDVISS